MGSLGSLEAPEAPEGATESHKWVTKEPRRRMESHGELRKGGTVSRRRTERHEEPRRSMGSHTGPRRAKESHIGTWRTTENQREARRDRRATERHGRATEGHGELKRATERHVEPRRDKESHGESQRATWSHRRENERETYTEPYARSGKSLPLRLSALAVKSNSLPCGHAASSSGLLGVREA